MADPTKTNLLTLTRHVLCEQRKHEDATGDLTLLLTAIQFGCKFVASCVRKAMLVQLIGLVGETNQSGDSIKKLDVLSNEIFINALKNSGKVSVLVSEEEDQVVVVSDPNMRGRYCVAFDPLDGSSNIDAAVNVGTIFGIFKTESDAPGKLSDILRPGTDLVAAGYCMYGSSCHLVLTTGEGVDGYTLDPTIGEFILTHPHIMMKPRGKIYSVNEGNTMYWDEACKQYFESLKFPKDPGAAPYSARYVGSMVADVHRTLLYGGIFAYPADKKSKKGKLRLLYECFPMAFIMEQAGGKATTGKCRVLDLVPENIHDRCGIFMGSKEDVEDVEKMYQAYP